MSPSESHLVIRDAVRDGVARAVAVVGLCGIALIHLLDLPGKFDEIPYMAWMYVGLIVGSLVLAGVLVRTSDKRAWGGAAALATSVVLGYMLSRTIGLPQATDDIGNWTEPLGLASLFVEGSLIVLSTGVLLGRSAQSQPSLRTEEPRSPQLQAA